MKSGEECSKMIEMMTLDVQRVITTGTPAEKENLFVNFDDLANNVTVNRNISDADFM
jgi:hypothetical protein